MSRIKIRTPLDKAIKTLQNKVFDGREATDSSAIILPKASTAKLDTLEDRVGTLAYDTTLGKVVINDGNSFVLVGDGAGIGGGGDFLSDGSVPLAGTLTVEQNTLISQRSQALKVGVAGWGDGDSVDIDWYGNGNTFFPARIGVTANGGARKMVFSLDGGGLVEQLTLFNSGSISVHGNKIQEVADPANPQDAATKNYVDNNAGSPVATKLLINIMESINGNVVAANVPFTFSRTGDQVVCQIGAFSGSAPNNWAFFYEFIPAEFRPFRSITLPYAVQKNAEPLGFGFVSIGSNGHLDFSGPNGEGFAGGTGTVPAFTLSWLVNEPA